MSIEVNVTQEDIDNGKRESCTRCPVALALTRAGWKGVGVSADYAWQSKGRLNDQCTLNDDDFFKMPAEAQAFVFNFDHNKPVKPLTFFLEDTL